MNIIQFLKVWGENMKRKEKKGEKRGKEKNNKGKN